MCLWELECISVGGIDILVDGCARSEELPKHCPVPTHRLKTDATHPT